MHVQKANNSMMASAIILQIILCIICTCLQPADGFSIYQRNKKLRPVPSMSLEDQEMQLKEHHVSCILKIKNYVYTPGYCNVTWDGVTCWDHARAGVVVTRNCPDYVSGLNRLNHMTRECQDDGTWRPNPNNNVSSTGWTNYSQCLLKPDEPDTVDPKHLLNIRLMSEIGYGISLAALTLAVISMLASRRLHCKSNSLHINLFLAFIFRAVVNFIKNELFIDDLGLEKDFVRNKDGTIYFSEGTHWECKLITTTFAYTVGASLMWIFMEGLYLHMLVYRTFFTERHGVWIYVIIGWFSPLLYVIPWVISRLYLEDMYCWTFSEKTGVLWIIEGPIALTMLINSVFFIDIVRVLCIRVRSHRHPHGSSQHLRKVAKFALVLIPLFGVFYIITISFPKGVNPTADIVYLYFEMFYNSFQGLLLALLFCFLNEEVQKEVKRCLKGRRFDAFATRTIFLSSWRKASTFSRRTTDLNITETSMNGTSYRPVRQSSKPPQLHWKSKMASRRSQSDSTSGGARRNSETEFNLMTTETPATKYSMEHV